MPTSRMSAPPCTGPAPPKATSANSRGSRPRSIDSRRMRPAMRWFDDGEDRLRRLFDAEAELARRARRPPCARPRRRGSCPARPSGCRIDAAEHDVGVGHRRLGAAAAIGDGPGTAPALRGPTSSTPPRSIEAMLPPPAPIVWTSIIGSRSGMRKSRLVSSATFGSPCDDDGDVEARAAHVGGDDVVEPRRGARSRAAAVTPAAGPERTM